jgi:zinc protease
VKSITREELTGFWKARYGPATAALVLTGDIGEKEAREQAERCFAGWKNPGAEAVTSLPAPPAPERRVILVDKPGAGQTVLLAFGLGVPLGTPDYPGIAIMNDVLGGLFSSRINMNLRERHGYTYGAFSGFFFDRFGGPQFAGAEVRTDVTAPAAEQLFYELNRIRTEPPSATELKLARDSEMRSLPADFQTDKSTSGRIAALFIHNLPSDYYAALPGRFAAVTPAEVERAAARHVEPKQMIVVAVGDRATIEPGMKALNLGPIEYRDAMGNPAH